MTCQTIVSLPCKYKLYGSLTQCGTCELAHDTGDETFQCPYSVDPVPFTRRERIVAILNGAKFFLVTALIVIVFGSAVIYVSNNLGRHFSQKAIASHAYELCIQRQNPEHRCAAIRAEMNYLLEEKTK